jgi:hypothetical protein
MEIVIDKTYFKLPSKKGSCDSNSCNSTPSTNRGFNPPTKEEIERILATLRQLDQELRKSNSAKQDIKDIENANKVFNEKLRSSRKKRW